MKLVLLAALAMLVPAACANKGPEERKEAVATAPAERTERADRAAQPAAAPAAAAVTTAMHAAPTTPSDFPRECVGYAGLIDRLKTCEAAGGTRAGLIQAYESLRASWSAVPADRRDEVARQCSAQAESLRSAVAATCGW